MSAKAVVQRVARELRSGEDERAARRHRRAPAPREPQRRADVGVHVEGLDDVMVRLSRCCTPVPGDEIMGFVTRGRGVSVHRTDCANAVSLSTGQGDRVIDVEWDNDAPAQSSWRRSRSRRSTGRSCCATSPTCSSEHHVNILVVHDRRPAPTAIARMRFEFELADPQHLDSVLSTIRQIDSVYDAYRILPGKGR